MAIRKTPTLAQQRAAFATLASIAPFKVGDRVKVLRNFKEDELGSNLSVISEDDEDVAGYIGKTFEITDTGGVGTYELDHDWYWPFFVLELVSEGKTVDLNDEYRAFVADDGQSVKVGCQEIPAAAVLELAEKVRKAQSEYKPPAKPAKARKRTATRR